MNRLVGTIIDLHVESHMSLVSVKVDNHTISSIVLETPNTAKYLSIGSDVGVLFKETEVIIATGAVTNISLQNKLTGTVSNIESANLLTRVVIDIGVGNIVSIITTNAANQLKLAVGDQVVAMIKTNEVALSA